MKYTRGAVWINWRSGGISALGMHSNPTTVLDEMILLVLAMLPVIKYLGGSLVY